MDEFTEMRSPLFMSGRGQTNFPDLRFAMLAICDRTLADVGLIEVKVECIQVKK